MEGIGEYLIRITAAALICAVATKLVSKGPVGSVVKLMAGVFMALTVVSPVVNIRLDQFYHLADDIRLEGQTLAQMGENSSREAIAERISEQTSAYILDKAEKFDATLTVSVRLSDAPIPIPVGVSLEGNASPYARKALTAYISEELGIDSEEILWTP